MGTAIYVPPVRLGGTGRVIFLPAAPAAALDSDEAVVRTTLAHIAAPDQCVDPVLTGDPFRSSHAMQAESNDPESQALAAHTARIETTMASWSGMHGVAIDAAVAARMVAAIDAIVAATPRRPSSEVALPPAWLAPQQRADRVGECTTIALSRPARHGMLAFVGVSMVRGPLNGVGFVLTLDRASGTWNVVAQRQSRVN